MPNVDSQSSESKKARSCCGLPLWGFIVVIIAVLLLIAAAVVIPVEFLVIRRQNADQGAQAALQQCQSQLTCANGGTDVVNEGFCSCICSNGFTGFDCTTADLSGCTTISLTGDTNINNVTIGDAIPRLIQQAQTNFSIALSGTEILAKLNSSNLSCAAENALVTFNGQAMPQSNNLPDVVNAANIIDGIAVTTITIIAGQFTTITLGRIIPVTTTSAATPSTVAGAQSSNGGISISISTIFATTFTISRSTRTPTSTSTVTTTMTVSSGAPLPTAAFSVSEEVLDFARVAVLYILQEESLGDASDAQVELQRFFTSAKPGGSLSTGGVGVEAARKVSVGNGNSVDLVDFSVDTANSNKVGAKLLGSRGFAPESGRYPPRFINR